MKAKHFLLASALLLWTGVLYGAQNEAYKTIY